MIAVYIANVPPPCTRPIASQTAHALLRYALCEQGQDLDAFTLCRTAEGKPYFREGGVEFSISHSGQWAVCALSDTAVGVDIERIRPVSLRVWSRYLASEPDEPYGGDREAILRWTRYEALLKRNGMAVKDPTAVYVTLTEIDGYLLTVCGDGEVQPLRWVENNEL